MIVAGANKYFRTPFNNEMEIETVVKDYAEYLFGSSILFIPKSKITTSTVKYGSPEPTKLLCVSSSAMILLTYGHAPWRRFPVSVFMRSRQWRSGSTPYWFLKESASESRIPLLH